MLSLVRGTGYTLSSVPSLVKPTAYWATSKVLLSIQAGVSPMVFTSRFRDEISAL